MAATKTKTNNTNNKAKTASNAASTEKDTVEVDLGEEEFPQCSVETLVFKSLKRTHDVFLSNRNKTSGYSDEGQKAKLACKINSEYYNIINQSLEPAAFVNEQEKEESSNTNASTNGVDAVEKVVKTKTPSQIAAEELHNKQIKRQTKLLLSQQDTSKTSKIIDSLEAACNINNNRNNINNTALSVYSDNNKKNSSAVVVRGPRHAPVTPKPDFHPHWKLYRVISGHLGWVRCLDFEPGNQWFATGSNDRTIKIWDSASAQLKLTLTGHISTVRGVAVSDRHPYLFSCGEDRTVKCWDLETNKVIRDYHGHLLSVYDLSIHPTLDVLVTASRDSTARVWDMRTRAQVHVLTGHSDACLSVQTQGANPQVITGSMDSTVKLWDLGMGKCITTLTNHKKTVRALSLHPNEFSFVSASTDNVKKWKFPNGDFMLNFDKRKGIVNSLACNQDNVMVSASDNGYLNFYDYKTGYNFQSYKAPPQPGSLESENGVYAVTFDKSGSRLVTAEADKTIKMYKEDENSTEETHPVAWTPQIIRTNR